MGLQSGVLHPFALVAEGTTRSFQRCGLWSPRDAEEPLVHCCHGGSAGFLDCGEVFPREPMTEVVLRDRAKFVDRRVLVAKRVRFVDAYTGHVLAAPEPVSSYLPPPFSLTSLCF